jgi:steroid delta-isomerase-like uncharacterized protein
MSIADNKVIVRRYIEEVWGNGDTAAEDDILAENYLDHNPRPGQAPGRAGHHQIMTTLRKAFPDLRITLDQMIAEGDTVVDRWTMHATHMGEFAGIAATGKLVTITGCDILRIADGQIVEIWHIEDILGLLQQIGIMPTSAPANPSSEVIHKNADNR